MSLPLLPKSFPAVYISGTEHFYTLAQMQAYGQACRAAGLEEAATMLETGELRGTKQDIQQMVAMFINIAKYFRSLK